MRLIDADALIETIYKNAEGNEGWYGDTWQFMRDIENAPTVDAVPHWIPCEERLPEKYDEYLCCDKRGDYYVNYLEDADWAREFTKNESIVAWMPLPNPYEGERKDDE